MDDHIHPMSLTNSSAGSSSSSSSSHICYIDSDPSENVEYFALKGHKNDHRTSSDVGDDDDTLSVLAFTEEDLQALSQSRIRRRYFSWCSSCSHWQGWSMFGVFIASTAILCWYFHCPSTMFVYLTWLVFIMPVELANFGRSLLLRKGMISLDVDHYSIKRIKPTYLSLISKRLRIAFLMLGCCIWSWAMAESMFGPFSNDWNASQSSNNIDARSIGPTFIAINLYNNNNLFPHYGDNLIKLIESIGGSQNTYVSIFESNSKDGTEKSLDELSHKFNVYNIAHTIVSGNNATQHLTKSDHVGIDDDGHKRIAFLANVRNEAMRPFYENTAQINGLNHSKVEFEKVLWLNDIVFDSSEIKELLQTNGGLYDEACAFDYMPLGLYDTWVTRDIDGNRAKPLWPYFAADRDVETLKEQKPILVDSCWNGAVAFDARWFRDSTAPLSKPATHKVSHLTKRDLPPATNGILPLRFRDSDICLSSECLLTSLDIHRALQPTRPVIVMNPKVVTAYDRKTFYLYHDIMRWHIIQPWRLIWERFVSGYLFESVTDMGRKPAQCFEAFQSLWSTPHPLAQKVKTNTEILKDVLANRWQ